MNKAKIRVIKKNEARGPVDSGPSARPIKLSITKLSETWLKESLSAIKAARVNETAAFFKG